MLHVSRITLNNSVKAQFGVSATHLIKQRLLEELKNELLFSNRTVSEMADDFNFSDPSHLMRFFKQQTGKTFTQYMTDYNKGIYEYPLNIVDSGYRNMVVDVQAFLYFMNHFTISGSSCEPSKKGLSVSSVFIRAMSSADRVKSNMSRFCFMRSGFTDLGIIMHTDIYRARTGVRCGR